ncbi:MAG: hypothetical protein AB7Q00_14800 [Phycisphaerales bacterium]
MKQEWVEAACAYAAKPADFYSGARKIIRARSITFEVIADDLVMADCGFTKSKMTMLRKLYLHEESRALAVEMWRGRLARKKYGSVSFHTYNHLVKGGALDAKRSKRASVMGPCLQSVCLTLLNNGRTAIDVFYRTTELFKKFPADLVFLRDEVLTPFDFSTAPIESITFHFANITIHPMYWVTVIPLLTDPIDVMQRIKAKDKHFHDWMVKWTARYVCPEHHRGIAKFAQAQRTKMDAIKRIPKKMMPKLQKYLRDNHPGHRNSYTEDDDE